jgi:hypothetical protein
MMNEMKGFGRKRLWSNLRHNSSILVEGVRNHDKIPSGYSVFGTRVEPGTVSSRSRSASSVLDDDDDDDDDNSCSMYSCRYAVGEYTRTVSEQRLDKHVPAETNTHISNIPATARQPPITKIEELLRTVFSVGSAPRLYNEDPRPAERN